VALRLACESRELDMSASAMICASGWPPKGLLNDEKAVGEAGGDSPNDGDWGEASTGDIGGDIMPEAGGSICPPNSTDAPSRMFPRVHSTPLKSSKMMRTSVMRMDMTRERMG
jgi:hypothetical protein